MIRLSSGSAYRDTALRRQVPKLAHCYRLRFIEGVRVLGGVDGDLVHRKCIAIVSRLARDDMNWCA